VVFCPGGLFPGGLLSGVGIFSGLLSGGLLSGGLLSGIRLQQEAQTFFVRQGLTLTVTIG